MRYFILIFLIACNSDRSTSEYNKSTAIDSLIAASDSTNDFLREFDTTLSNTIDQVKSQIAKLSKEKEAAEVQIKEVPVYHDAIQYEPSDDKDKRIYELTMKVLAYEREIARLKRQINDSSDVGKVDEVPNEEKPNDKSLVVTLDRRLRDETELSEQGVTVYIMPFGKRSKKLMNYDIGCNLKEIGSLDAKQASYYKGQYFFNDVAPGKYLIKVCAYYGNYKVIRRENSYQTVAMQMSPPIQ